VGTDDDKIDSESRLRLASRVTEYLKANSDVAAYVDVRAVISGLEAHSFLEEARITKRSINASAEVEGIDEKAVLRLAFNEAEYLKANPDVAAAVEAGLVATGQQHWENHGFEEELRGVRFPSWRQPSSLVQLKKVLAFEPLDIVQIAEALGSSATLPDLKMLRTPGLQNWIRVSRMLQKAERKPLISLIMPVYNTDERWLRLAIESVQLQIYRSWELCIVDDNSSNPDVQAVLEEYANIDSRIRIHLRDTNGHISLASNDALTMASGDYVALLDHDDELTPDALAKVVLMINEDPDVDFIYSDEDKIDETGRVYGRAMKPRWSPELIWSCGYTTHLSVYSSRILRAVGGFRSEFDGAQDYDLVLRVSEITDRIAHIPEVLYHWRAIETSTAKSADAKSYALPRAESALLQHMTRRGVTGEIARAQLPGYTRFDPQIQGCPLVSIVIPTAGKIVEMDGREVNFIENCVGSIVEKSTYANYEIIVSDNGNLSEATLTFLRDRGVKLIPYDAVRFNLAEKMNLGADHATGEYLIIMNDDTQVISPYWIEELLRFNQLERVGVVGAKLLFADHTIQHIGVSIIGGAPGHPMAGEPRGALGHLGLATVPHNVSAVTGACMMTRADLFRRIGGFDLLFDLNYNDVDYCLKVVDQGYRIVINPLCELYHFESVSRDVAGSVRQDELELFQSRWGKRYQAEQYLRG
jgi:glycosyltransferase involved in cell wall biosynthesis